MRFPIWPCSLRGLPSCSSHPEHWCALTAPFHPYRIRAGTSRFPPREGIRRYLFCGTFLPVAGTGCYPAQCPVESGLSSPLFRGQRPSFLLRPEANLAQRPKNGQRPSPARPPHSGGRTRPGWGAWGACLLSLRRAPRHGARGCRFALAQWEANASRSHGRCEKAPLPAPLDPDAEPGDPRAAGPVRDGGPARCRTAGGAAGSDPGAGGAADSFHRPCQDGEGTRRGDRPCGATRDERVARSTLDRASGRDDCPPFFSRTTPG